MLLELRRLILPLHLNLPLLQSHRPLLLGVLPVDYHLVSKDDMAWGNFGTSLHPTCQVTRFLPHLEVSSLLKTSCHLLSVVSSTA